MAETHEMIITEKNWEEIKKLFTKISDSEFFIFCLINEIIEEGLERLKENSLPEK